MIRNSNLELMQWDLILKDLNDNNYKKVLSILDKIKNIILKIQLSNLIVSIFEIITLVLSNLYCLLASK